MAKPEAIITIVRGTVREPRNYGFTYISALDEILITEQETGHSMRFTYTQLLDMMLRTEEVRSKYKHD